VREGGKIGERMRRRRRRMRLAMHLIYGIIPVTVKYKLPYLHTLYNYCLF